MEYDQMQETFLKALNRFGRIRIPGLPSGISKGEFMMLEGIFCYLQSHPEAGGVFVSELAADLQVSPPAVSRMLRDVEEKNLVERTVDPTDRRNILVLLTPQGEQVLRESKETVAVFFRRVADHMGREDMVTLISLWNRLIDVMQEELGGFREGVRKC